MTTLKKRLTVEFANIRKSLAELPRSRSCQHLSKIELAGVAALLHNFYNGIEKVLKDILTFQKVALPEGATWHKDLINLAVEKKVLEKSTVELLTPYLAFRHFFVHAYVVDLEAERLEPLVQEVDMVFEQVKKDLAKLPAFPTNETAPVLTTNQKDSKE